MSLRGGRQLRSPAEERDSQMRKAARRICKRRVPEFWLFTVGAGCPAPRSAFIQKGLSPEDAGKEEQ